MAKGLEIIVIEANSRAIATNGETSIYYLHNGTAGQTGFVKDVNKLSIGFTTEISEAVAISGVPLIAIQTISRFHIKNIFSI